MTLGCSPKRCASTPWIPLDLCLSYVRQQILNFQNDFKYLLLVVAELRQPEVSGGYLAILVDLQ